MIIGLSCISGQAVSYEIYIYIKSYYEFAPPNQIPTRNEVFSAVYHLLLDFSSVSTLALHLWRI